MIGVAFSPCYRYVEFTDMGNGGINIRFLWWHLQISKEWKPKVSFNKYHWDNKLADGWFKVHEWDMRK